jgi:hypothetical protein
MNLGYKLKPDTFDGTGSLIEFFVQFNLIANANSWTDSAKTVALVSCHRGKARSVLESVLDIERLKFSELKAKLELRFGEGYLCQSYYSHFTNRKQKQGEDEATLGSDIERLAQLAYPECSHSIRDKIACAQFISALTNGFVKQTLQLEGVSSLKTAIQRAMTIRVIRENNYVNQKQNFESDKKHQNIKKKNFLNEQSKEENKTFKRKSFSQNEKKTFQDNKTRFAKECWQCGTIGHFRADCPAVKQDKEN